MSDYSDSSESSSVEDGRIYEDEDDGENSDQLPPDQDHEDQSIDEDIQDVDTTDRQQGRDIDVSKMSLCPKHKSGFMVPDSCAPCATALSLITNQDVVKKLTSNNASGSGILSRYKGRCDTIEPTLALSNDTIQLALGVFTKGVFKDSRMWVEIVRNYLSLPGEQHELLNTDLIFEDLLNQFKREKRFQNLFRFANDLAKCLKNLRISNRPLFALIERVNEDMEKAKMLAEDAGIIFPGVGSVPVRTGVNVPRIGRVVHDTLHYSSTLAAEIFPLPDIVSQIRDHLEENEARVFHKEMEAYRVSVRNQFLKLFDLLSKHLNASDDWLIFYTE